jgi:RNA polymerase sigma-70 factor (ECF subfamily)
MEHFNLNALNDEALIEWARCGDLDAFEVLVKRYESCVFGFLRALTNHDQDAEDTTQETWINVWKGISGYRGGEIEFIKWVFQIATNCWFDELRGRKAKKRGGEYELFSISVEDEAYRIPTTQPDPEQIMVVKEESEEKSKKVKEAVGKIGDAIDNVLSEKAREYISNVHQHGKSYAVISEARNIKLSTLKQFLRRARRKLEKDLRESYPRLDDVNEVLDAYFLLV